jgi:hypothetical protein
MQSNKEKLGVNLKSFCYPLFILNLYNISWGGECELSRERKLWGLCELLNAGVAALHLSNCMYGYYKLKNPPYWTVAVNETAASLRSWNSLLAVSIDIYNTTKCIKKDSHSSKRNSNTDFFSEIEVWRLIIYAVRSGIINSIFITVTPSLFRYQPSPCRFCGG